jgi:hypothetical protein
MQCDRCRQSIPDGVATCPYCGALESSPGERIKAQYAKILAVVLTAAVLIIWQYLKP